MSKVYVSSTFRDLRTCRAQVEEAVRLLGHQDVAMEHYGAEPRPALRKVLADVGACDVYIGIFGRRYGWVPPGTTQSITEQEYRHARRTGKEILVFLLDDDAVGWPESEPEPPARREQLAALRQELSDDFLAARFASCEELSVKVIAALANLAAPAPTPADAQREDELLQRVLDADAATVSQSEQALVDMGSAAYAALLRKRLRTGRGSQTRRMTELGQLAAIAQQNHRTLPILRDLLGADDPAVRAAVVFRFAQRALAGQQASDDDIRALLALATDDSSHVRREVGHAMWKFLPRDGAVRDEMLEALTALTRFDEDETVRKVAGYSLQRVQRGW